MNTIRGVQPAAERWPGVGDVIRCYRLVGLLAEGRSGPLFVAAASAPVRSASQHASAPFDVRGTAMSVALRSLRPELAQGPGFRERFLELTRIAARSEHPNLANVLELAEAEGRYFVAMEYLPGESLAALLARCQLGACLGPDMAAHIVRRVASAVQYVRALGEALPRPVRQLNVDLDASSIVVTHGGAVKWLGAASPVSAGAHGDDDAAFALGRLLWTCLHPQQPSVGRAGVEASQAAVSEAPRPASARPGLDEALAAIAAQAVAGDPHTRFQSVQALCSALDRYLLRRGCHTTPQDLRRWMERAFGADRAALQLQIAAGRDIGAALSRLHRTAASNTSAGSPRRSRPRPLWTTHPAASAEVSSASVRDATTDERAPASAVLARRLPSALQEANALSDSEASSPASQHADRRWLPGTMVAGAVTLAAIVAWTSHETTPQSESAATTPRRPRGRVDVRSTPPGAAVFIDGEPTGLRTPVLLAGLPTNQPLRVRVAKAGFTPLERRVELTADEAEPLDYQLLASDGLVVFRGAPRGARIYVDDQEVNVTRSMPLAIGSHEVHVEAAGALIFSEHVVIAAGEQTINLGPARAR